jgi:hypothetical protein
VGRVVGNDQGGQLLAVSALVRRVPTARFERATPALGAVVCSKIAQAQNPDLRSLGPFPVSDRR